MIETKRNANQKQVKKHSPSNTLDKTSVPSPRAISRKQLAFAVYGGILLIAVIIGTIVTYNVLNAVPNPSKTLTTYCTTLKSQDYGTAYKQLDTATQKLVTVVEFVQYYDDNAGAGKITDCHVNSVNTTQAQGSGSIAYTYADKSSRNIPYTLKSDANGNWHMSNVAISTPSTVLTNYCNAIKQQDYANAYSFVSNDVKVQENEAQFATSTKRFGQAGGKGIAACSISNVNDAGAQASGTITYTSHQGKVAVVDYVLVDESGLWKLDSEQPRRQR